MSDTEDKQRTENNLQLVPENVDDVDLYSDILSEQDGYTNKLKEKIQKLSLEKNLLMKSLDSLQHTCEQLQKDHKTLEVKYKNVSFNASALFKTAKTEIERKDRMIRDLRRENEVLLSRRTPANEALRRARRIMASVSPHKRRAPSRDRKEGSPGPPPEKRNSSPQSKLDEKEVEETEDNTKKGNQIVVPETSLLPKLPIVNNGGIKAPPPLQGPQTAYSKRLYKKLYGVSPRKSPLKSIKCLESENNTSFQQTTRKTPPSKQETVVKEVDVVNDENETIKNEDKVPRIASKLQEDVKEFIKLGTNSVNKSFSPASRKIMIQNRRKSLDSTESSPLKPNTMKSSSSKPQQIILQCDLRKNKIPEDLINLPPNSVSLNETIGNILKNQQAGLYDIKTNTVKNHDVADVTLNAHTTGALVISKERKPEVIQKLPIPGDSCSETGKNSGIIENIKENKPHSLLANLNKRITSKRPVVSPATFGKLVPCKPKISSRNVTLQRNEKKIKLVEESPDMSRKQNLSEILSPSKDILTPDLQKTKLPPTVKQSKIKNRLTSLFGQSPSKTKTSSSDQISPITAVKEKAIERVRIPSPVHLETYSGSPIFPSSPSLDSDGPEDLVIDTTACSQNTSRVSENERNDEDLKENASVLPNKRLLSSDSSSTPHSKKQRKECMSLSDTLSLSESKEIPLKGSRKNVNDCIKSKEPPGSNINIETSSSSPIVVAEKENGKGEFALPDLSECFSLDNQNQVFPPNKPMSIIQSESVIITKPLKKSDLYSDAFCKLATPSINLESDQPSFKENELKNNNVNRDIIVKPPGFSLSPPQLTMVSAFKHSENSLFNIAEDTVGFVSALTRVQDRVSPIRTPDKKDSSLLLTQQSEPVDCRESSKLMKPVISTVHHNVEKDDYLLNAEVENLTFKVAPQSETVTDENSQNLKPAENDHPSILMKNGEESHLHSETLKKASEPLDDKVESNEVTVGNSAGSKDNSDIQTISKADSARKMLQKEPNKDETTLAQEKLSGCVTMKFSDPNARIRRRPVRLIAQFNSKSDIVAFKKGISEQQSPENDKNKTNRQLLNPCSSIVTKESCSKKDICEKKIEEVMISSNSLVDQGTNLSQNNKRLPHCPQRENITSLLQGKVLVEAEIKKSSTEIKKVVTSKLTAHVVKKVTESVVGTDPLSSPRNKFSLKKTFSPDSEQKQTFKRSESLRKLSKPVPKINYNSLNKDLFEKDSHHKTLRKTETGVKDDINELKNKNNQSNIISTAETPLDKSNVQDNLNDQPKPLGKSHLDDNTVKSSAEVCENIIDMCKVKLKQTTADNSFNDCFRINNKDDKGLLCERIINNSEINKSLNVPVKSHMDDKTCEKQNVSTKSTQESIKMNELDKIPHIASINQKIRVSKYQGIREKVNWILKSEKKSTPKGHNKKLNKKSSLPEISLRSKTHHGRSVSLDPDFQNKRKIPEIESLKKNLIYVKDTKNPSHTRSGSLEPDSLNKNADNESSMVKPKKGSHTKIDAVCCSKIMSSEHAIKPELVDRQTSSTKFNKHSRRSQSHSPDLRYGRKSTYYLRRSESKSPARNYRSKSDYRQRKARSRSLDPSYKSKSHQQDRSKQDRHFRRSRSSSPDDHKSKNSNQPRSSQKKSSDLNHEFDHHRRINENITSGSSYRNKYDHRLRKPQNKSCGPLYRSYHSRRSQSRSPDPSYRSKSGHHSRRSQSKSPDPSYRSKSGHYPRRPQSKSPDHRYRNKSGHHSRRSQSKSPDPSYISKCGHHSRRSQSKSPDPSYRSKSGHHSRRSQSKSPDASYRIKSHQSLGSINTPSCNTNSKRDSSRNRKRSLSQSPDQSCMSSAKYYRDRSRSVTPPRRNFHRASDCKPSHGLHLITRGRKRYRSRSRSMSPIMLENINQTSDIEIAKSTRPHTNQSRMKNFSRETSPEKHFENCKSRDDEQNAPSALNLMEEFKKMRMELELVKHKLIIAQQSPNKASSEPATVQKEISDLHKITKRQSDSTEVTGLKPTKQIRLSQENGKSSPVVGEHDQHVKLQNNSCNPEIDIERERMEQASLIDEQQLNTSSKHSSVSPAAISTPRNPCKSLKLNRMNRVRKLSDSEVNVVSSSTSSRTPVPYKPETALTSKI